MATPFDIVKDSSIWFDQGNFSAVNRTDGLLRIGIVKKAYNADDSGEIRYLVEIQNHNDKVELNCRLLRRFGGVYNYEDYIYQGYKISDKPDPVATFEAKAGDAVLVGLLNGQGREGIIIGGLMHPARQGEVKSIEGPQYKAEFNGVETSINKDGEITVTFKGLPTNINKLNDTPSGKLPKPQYDTNVGSSFYKFDKTGSWQVNDNAKSNKQLIKIDKPNGTISIVSGAITLTLTKSAESVSLKCKTTTITSSDKVSVKTKTLSIDASTKGTLKAPKVAIGKDGVELLDQLAKLIDAVAKVAPISPVGPCTPLMATPQWSQVEQIKAKIKEITGTF